jgi:hypothetical protein
MAQALVGRRTLTPAPYGRQKLAGSVDHRIGGNHPHAGGRSTAAATGIAMDRDPYGPRGGFREGRILDGIGGPQDLDHGCPDQGGHVHGTGISPDVETGAREESGQIGQGGRLRRDPSRAARRLDDRRGKSPVIAGGPAGHHGRDALTIGEARATAA